MRKKERDTKIIVKSHGLPFKSKSREHRTQFLLARRFVQNNNNNNRQTRETLHDRLDIHVEID